jgi:hypothetical protein
LPKNITVTCGAATGKIEGTITKSTGGAATGVQVIVKPTGASDLPAVTTNAQGAYSVSGVPAGLDGTLALTGLPSGCTVPAGLNYTGLQAAQTVTKNIVLTCVATGSHTYPFSATWGAITNTGPTGRQVTLSFAIDMGAAPGRPDIAGSAADPLLGISFRLEHGAKIDYVSRTILAPEFDLGIVGKVTNPAPPAPSVDVAVSTTSGETATGNVNLIRLTFNIVAGASGTVTPVVTLTEVLATTNQINVKSSVVIQPMPALTIP